MNPENMTVLLTGACGGIGRALATQLAEAGASLYLTDRNAEALAELQQQLATIAGDRQLISAKAIDLQNDVELDQWIDSLSRQQAINVLVNNAGVSRFELFENQQDSDIELIMNLNSIVPMKLTRKLLPMLKQQPQARIVNIASTFGAIGFPGYSVYSASKYAIRGFSQALARELADTGITVGSFLPRATQTAINSPSVVEFNRRMKVTMDPPQKVATALLQFLCSRRQEMAIGWPEKLLVRVNSLFPWLIGNALSKKLPLVKQYAV